MSQTALLHSAVLQKWVLCKRPLIIHIWLWSEEHDPKSAYLYSASLKPSQFWKCVVLRISILRRCKHNKTENIKTNTVSYIAIPSLHTANTIRDHAQIGERPPFTASNYMHSWGFLTISQKWDESLFLISQQPFWKNKLLTQADGLWRTQTSV